MFVAGLDVGTTGCKIAVYDSSGAEKQIYYREYDVTRREGCHEIDFCAVRKSVMELLKNAASSYRLSALGVTSFGESFVMLDENDNVLAPSMLYTDPRGEDECGLLAERVGSEKLARLTGTKPHQMYSISKMMWLKANRPELWSKCVKIMLGEDYIVYTLSGNAQIDYSLAARTGAFDIQNKCWAKEVFAAAGIDRCLMSYPAEPGAAAGKMTDAVKTELGIDYDITIVNGCHDQVAAMIGSGVTETGQAMDGTGTVECIPVVLDSVPWDMRLYKGGYSVVPYINGKYACYALSYTGGAALKWFRDNFADYEKQQAEKNRQNVYAVLDKNTPEKPTGILVLPHFAGAATPYMDNDSKAAFVGLTLETTKYDLYKALMEGASYEILVNFNELKSIVGNISEIKATGGGASSDIWLQIKADVLGIPVCALNCRETGAAGTAALAGKAIGVWNNITEITARMSGIRKVFIPDKENSDEYAELFKKYIGLYKAVSTLGEDIK